MASLETKYESVEPQAEKGCEDNDKCCKCIEIRLGIKLCILVIVITLFFRALDAISGIFGEAFLGNLLLLAAIAPGFLGCHRAYPLLKDDSTQNRVACSEGFKFVLLSYLAQTAVVLIGMMGILSVSIMGERAAKNLSGWFFGDLILCALQFYYWKVSERFEK